MDLTLESLPGRIEKLRALAPAGFAMGLHVRFTMPTYLFQTYPPAWLEEYSRDGLLMRDPTVLWAFENLGTIAWSELADPDGVLARSAAQGLRHGVAVSLEEGGSRSLASFTREDRELRPDEVAVLEAELREIHEATASARPLPAATREALRRMSVAYTHR